MQRFLDFIGNSPSSFHAAFEVAQQLQGFTYQDEAMPWDATPGGHYTIRGGGIIAWWIPETTASSFRIIGAHTDSPGFMLKPTPQAISAGWHQAQVEVYGSPILASWLDRELVLAGRIMLTDGTERLVTTGPLLRIPHLAIHLSRDNDIKLSKQTHMQPLFAVGDSTPELLEIIADHAEVRSDEIVTWELITCDAQPPALFGANSEFIASGRLDNLSSVYAGLQAFLCATQDAEEIIVLACFDHEEIGSATISGAAGPFLSDVLERTARAMGKNHEQLRQMFARSSCVSADAAHSVHPNYISKHDPVSQPRINHGPVLKFNSNQRYASNAPTAAMWERACASAGVPSQKFTSNNDVPCGSTIGPITATRLGIATVDVGVPLLSMHSIREMAGVVDMEWFTQALHAYLVD